MSAPYLPGFITVHDADTSPRKHPDGVEMRVRAEAIHSIRPYETGRVRAVLNVGGRYVHVIETEAELAALISSVARQS